MRFRLGYAAGFATGYYLGAKAGRQRYDQINRSLRKLRRSDTFETVAERARTVIDEGVGKAKGLVDRGNDADAGPLPPTTADGSSNGTNTIPAAAPLTGQPTIAPPPADPPPPYSSSR